MTNWVSYDKLIRALKPVLPILNSVINELGLPKTVAQNALNTYKQLILKQLTRGRHRESLIGACIHLSCKEQDYPIKLEILCNSLSVTKKELVRQERFIKKFLKTFNQVSAEQFIKKFGYELRLTPQEITKALAKLEMVREQLINHLSVMKAAICIYLTTEHGIRAVAKISGLSRNGIHKALKKLKTYKKES